MDLDSGCWSKPSRLLWTLFEWSFIGAGMIFALVTLSVNSFGAPASKSSHSKAIKHKRILVVEGIASKLGRAVLHMLRGCKDEEGNFVQVISISRGHGKTGHRDNVTIICDLTRSQNDLLRQLWKEGIDLVINCELEEEEDDGSRRDVAQRVETIGRNIQTMMNVMGAMVPLMSSRTSEGKEGTFVLLRNSQSNISGLEEEKESGVTAYDDLLRQISGVDRVSNVNLLQINCHEQEEESEEMARNILNVIQSGKTGKISLSRGRFWENFFRNIIIRKSIQRE